MRELGEDRVFDAKETKRVGTIAMAYPVRSGGQGERVLLVGQGRAIGHRVDSADSSLLPMCEITALLDVPDGNVTSEDQVELTNALRALSRVDVGRTRFVGALARGSMAQKCYRLADDIDLSASERQSLLQQDDAQQMVRQIVGAVLARVESALPETLGANDRGFARIVAILNRAFASPSDRLLLAAALDVGQPGRNAIEPLVKRYAQAGRLGTVVTHALWRRPDADELWSYVLASGEPADETKPGFRSATPGTSPLKLWPNGSTLHIRFLEAEPKLREAVMRIARQWLQYANLQFVVLDARDKLPGDIRISIDGTNSVWSYVGTDARGIPPAEPTMNLGRLALGGRAAEFQKVVLKQFGVALGLMLEHQNPNGRIEWDRAAVMSTMTGPPNLWSKHVVEANILKRAPQTIPQYRDFDARSVMLYEFEADWLLSKKSQRGGTELSASDKQFIAELYPGVTRKRPAPAPAHKSTTRALRRA